MSTQESNGKEGIKDSIKPKAEKAKSKKGSKVEFEKVGSVPKKKTTKAKVKATNPHFKNSRKLAAQSAYEFGQGCKFEYNRIFHKEKVKPSVTDHIKHHAGTMKDRWNAFWAGWNSKEETGPIVAGAGASA